MHFGWIAQLDQFQKSPFPLPERPKRWPMFLMVRGLGGWGGEGHKGNLGEEIGGGGVKIADDG